MRIIFFWLFWLAVILFVADRRAEACLQTATMDTTHQEVEKALGLERVTMQQSYIFIDYKYKSCLLNADII